MKRIALMLAVSVVVMAPKDGFASLFNLGSEQLVQTGGAEIAVNGYSVPSYVDWDNDGKKDLVIGEGGASFAGYVRVYRNVGTASSPQFSDHFYAESNGSTLVYSCGCDCGCMGLFPRVVYWDGDNRKDLITGTPEGNIILYFNIGTETAPTFDGGTLLQVGPAGEKTDIYVGLRATPTIVDWNSDGRKDLVVGTLEGSIHIFLNEGSDVAPDFLIETFANEESGSHLLVPPLAPTFGRSSPVILDLDGDGKKDLLTGNTDGQLLFYSNVNIDAAPTFSGYSLVESNGIAIDLPGEPRSRPFVCDWTGDGYLDVLIGAGDGKVHLYQCVPEPGTICLLGLGGLVLLRKRKA